MAVAALVVAAVLFFRFGTEGQLSRDEAIYSYAGQRLTAGVAPYASIFDAKGPVAATVAGGAAWSGELIGVTDLFAIRLGFLAFSLLSVLAVYLLAARLFGSGLAGMTAAIVFAASPAFAMDALAGPNAKTPGVFFVVLSMVMMVERRWSGAAFTGSLGMLTWQPYFVYPVVAGVLALCLSPRRQRWRNVGRTVLSGGIPVLATVVIFAAAGRLSMLVEATVEFPLTGVAHAHTTLAEHLAHVARVATLHGGGLLFWLGLLLLCVLMVLDVLRHRHSWREAVSRPLTCVVLLTGVGVFGYAMYDFQSYPDLYPLLPYVALGFGGAAGLIASTAAGRAGRIGVTLVVASLVVLVLVRWDKFADHPRIGQLAAQRSDACGLSRIVVPGSALYVLGDPVPLVLTRRVNPDRFIYLASGAARWKVDHTPRGLQGWTAEMEAARPSVVVLQGFTGPVHDALSYWLRHEGYRRTFLGQWRVFVTPQARERALDQNVRLTPRATQVATGRHGHPLPASQCHLTSSEETT
jgi:hypothetical protein